ncbi:IS3 family transposase [Spirillospora sp. CA-108201]
MPKPYPPGFRSKALDLVESGRNVREVAAALGIAGSCLHRWRSHDLVERGLKAPSAGAVESAALAAVNQRIQELENEVKILRKAAAAVEEVVPPKRRFELVTGSPMRESRSSSPAWPWVSPARDTTTPGPRPPSARAIRHAWLTDLIGTVYQASRQTYGSPRVHAELVQVHQITVGRNTVAMLMRRQGLSGLPLRLPEPAVGHRHHRHPTREGKIYCCVVIDAFSRWGVGWAIDSRGEHGIQFTSWAFTDPARKAGLLHSLGTVGDPYDNAVAEAFWGRMQTELFNRRRWNTRLELANAIFEYIEGFHNRTRRHSALGWKAPQEFEQHHQLQATVSSQT